MKHQVTAQVDLQTVGKDRDDPLIQEFLELGHRPDRALPGVLAAILDTAAGVTGDVLGKQRPDGGKTRPGRALLPGRPLVGGLNIDPHRPAGVPERLGHEHHAVIHVMKTSS